MSYILTASGKQFHFGDHTRMVAALDIMDIAHALGNLCRFTGQCRRFYSVAEHSVHVSRLLPNNLALVGLLHDATEAYCADIAKPLKALLPDYRAVEAAIWLAVAEKFDLPSVLPAAVKRADAAMLKLEVNYLLPPNCATELNLPASNAWRPLRYWGPTDAKRVFLSEYRRLEYRRSAERKDW